MITNKTITKEEVFTHLRKHKQNRFDVWDLYSNQDKKEFIKELEKQLRKSPVSIVLVEGDR